MLLKYRKIGVAGSVYARELSNFKLLSRVSKVYVWLFNDTRNTINVAFCDSARLDTLCNSFSDLLHR